MSDRTQEELLAMRNECNAIITLRDALRRLESNPDFRRIVNTYIHEEPARITMLLSDPSLNLDPEKRDIHRNELTERLIGISRFADYLRTIHQRGEMAEKQLHDIDTNQEQENAASEAENSAGV